MKIKNYYVTKHKLLLWNFYFWREKNFSIYYLEKQLRFFSIEEQNSLSCAKEMPRQKFGLRVTTTLKNKTKATTTKEKNIF